MDLDASAAGGSSNWSSCVSVGGLASLGVAGLLWFLSKAEGERADRLRDIASHERLDGEQLPLHARLPYCHSFLHCPSRSLIFLACCWLHGMQSC